MHTPLELQRQRGAQFPFSRATNPTAGSQQCQRSVSSSSHDAIGTFDRLGLAWTLCPRSFKLAYKWLVWDSHPLVGARGRTFTLSWGPEVGLSRPAPNRLKDQLVHVTGHSEFQVVRCPSCSTYDAVDDLAGLIVLSKPHFRFRFNSTLDNQIKGSHNSLSVGPPNRLKDQLVHVIF
jgi:hypothetical protein